ncbi:MAG TPA: hypothetical protein VD931_01930 [Baekduia sp.]|nr:hypothetical protein [Baekduia sp.]
MTDLATPRFPSVPEGKGHYESFYLTATAPQGGRAVWVRNTILKRPGAPPRPTLWVTLFEAGAPPARARVTLDEAPEAAGWLRCGTAAHAGPERFRGAIDGASWELRLEAGEPELQYLPAQRLYDTRLPSTKAVALHPRARVSGTATAGDRSFELDGWDAMAGHNWGAEHAEHWIWLHAALPGGWVDLVLGRTRLGPVLAPWLGGGALSVDGRRTRLGGPRGRARVTVAGERVELEVPAGRERLLVRTQLPETSTVRWDYASPSGAARDVRNCSVADADMQLTGRRWEVAAATAIEAGVPAA